MCSSFLDRLKKKSVIPATPEDQKKEKLDTQTHDSTPEQIADQLHVDIYKASGAIIVYAQLAATTINDYNVTIEGDGDIVTIKGKRSKPNGEFFPGHTTENKEKILEECSWGQFYRQIILPAEVDASKTDAQMHEGVLMLYLPLKATSESGVRIQVKQI